MEWGPILLTFKLAGITTVLLLVIAIPLSYWLAYTRSSVRPVVETLVSMPLVLPPTVIGFYLLMAFSPNNGLGQWLDQVLGLRLVFSFTGLVVASLLYSLPFMVHPILAGFRNLPDSLREAAALLGKSSVTTIFRVLLPNCQPAVLTGVVLAFAHTIGEFGVVLMIGGNIPDQTKVASIAIYDEVEALQYGHAHQYAALLFVLTFCILLTVNLVNGNGFKSFWGKRA